MWIIANWKWKLNVMPNLNWIELQSMPFRDVGLLLQGKMTSDAKSNACLVPNSKGSPLSNIKIKSKGCEKGSPFSSIRVHLALCIVEVCSLNVLCNLLILNFAPLSPCIWFEIKSQIVGQHKWGVFLLKFLGQHMTLDNARIWKIWQP